MSNGSEQETVGFARSGAYKSKSEGLPKFCIMHFSVFLPLVAAIEITPTCTKKFSL